MLQYPMDLNLNTVVSPNQHFHKTNGRDFLLMEYMGGHTKLPPFTGFLVTLMLTIAHMGSSSRFWHQCLHMLQQRYHELSLTAA